MQRYKLQDIFTDSPSLDAQVPDELVEAWARVCVRSQQEWPYVQFPEDCPWMLAQLLDADL